MSIGFKNLLVPGPDTSLGAGCTFPKQLHCLSFTHVSSFFFFPALTLGNSDAFVNSGHHFTYSAGIHFCLFGILLNIYITKQHCATDTHPTTKLVSLDKLRTQHSFNTNGYILCLCRTMQCCRNSAYTLYRQV